jgi:hypothetical protein
MALAPEWSYYIPCRQRLHIYGRALQPRWWRHGIQFVYIWFHRVGIADDASFQNIHDSLHEHR